MNPGMKAGQIAIKRYSHLGEHTLQLPLTGEPERVRLSDCPLEFIASMAGFRSLRLSRCVEQPNRYLLLVEWDRLEDHTEGFRGSPEYKQWRALLHHFYDPFPTVEHYKLVTNA